MKISKLFHWLYATLMFLPLLALPIFGIYSHRHTIDSGSIEVPQNQVVDFNQPLKNGNFVNNDYWTNYFSTLEILDNNAIVVTSSNNDGTLLNTDITYHVNHTYYISFYASSSTSSQINIGIDLLNSASEQYQIFGYVNPNNVLSHYSFNYIPLYTADNNQFRLCFRHYADVDSRMTLANIWLVDLTQAFGVGNEPTSSQMDNLYSLPYYSYVLSRKELLPLPSITLNESDIMSQFTYQIYNLEDKYLNFDNVLNFGGLYNWIQLNAFDGNAPIYFTMFWHLLTYWFLVSLFWLIFDVLMYVPNLAHRWLDRSSLQ